LIAGLLCWLDARSTGAQVLLRLENLDRERTKPGYVDALQRDLEWFGLEWDGCVLQSDNHERHDAVLDALVRQGRIFACGCSRAEIRSAAQRAPDGSVRYPGTCRSHVVDEAQWRSIDRPLRLRLEAEEIRLVDESGLDLSGDAHGLFGDPILRRRDGAHAYHFASVVDDAYSGIDRVVRGRDLAPSTILQVALQHVLGMPTPVYRHHLLFMEKNGTKLSKLHGAVNLEMLRATVEPEELCGLLAAFVGLVPTGTVCRPVDLVSEFDWRRVHVEDVVLEWNQIRGLRLA
jgi:glutamyl-tRNA synthetase/glutamyl-Q tRNA(Asp) synthetase